MKKSLKKTNIIHKKFKKKKVLSVFKLVFKNTFKSEYLGELMSKKSEKMNMKDENVVEKKT